MRFHGRNASTWNKRTGSAAERFDYLYSEEELEEWVGPLRELAGESESVYAMFNNNGRSEMPATGLEGLEPEEVAGDPSKGEVAQAPANALMLEARCSAELDERLAAVLAAEHAHERRRGVLEALGHVLAVAELALGEPAAEPLQALGEAMDEVVDQEALEPRAEDDQEAEIARRELRLGEVVLRDLAADRDAGSQRQAAEDGLGDRAADVVEVDVDAVRARLLQRRR